MTPHRAGSVFYSKSQGLWVGALRVPTGPDTRRLRRVSSKLFCKTLAKFSELHQVEPPTSTPNRGALRRRERLVEARKTATHTKNEFFAKCRAQKGLCAYCGERGYRRKMLRNGRRVLFPILVEDHMIPLARGGHDGIDNVAAVCGTCNQKKGTMTADEYLATL